MSWKLVIVVVLILGTAAFGQTSRYFCASNGDWDDEMNWCNNVCAGCGTKPSDDDIAVILAPNICNLDTTEVAETIVIEKSGSDEAVLNIKQSGVLQLFPDSDGTSTVDGAINFSGNGKIEIAFEDDTTGHRHTFEGGGEIVGTSSTQEIRLEGKSVATPHEHVIENLLVRGALKIARLNDENVPVLILKHGTIHANIADRLEINVGGLDDEFDSGGNSLLKVSTDPDAVMAIGLDCANGATCINICLEYTDVDVLTGTLVTHVEFKTELPLTMEPGGIVDARQGATFSATCPQ